MSSGRKNSSNCTYLQLSSDLDEVQTAFLVWAYVAMLSKHRKCFVFYGVGGGGSFAVATNDTMHSALIVSHMVSCCNGSGVWMPHLVFELHFPRLQHYISQDSKWELCLSKTIVVLSRAYPTFSKVNALKNIIFSVFAQARSCSSFVGIYRVISRWSSSLSTASCRRKLSKECVFMRSFSVLDWKIQYAFAL